jgi:hypothetical protein
VKAAVEGESVVMGEGRDGLCKKQRRRGEVESDAERGMKVFRGIVEVKRGVARVNVEVMNVDIDLQKKKWSENGSRRTDVHWLMSTNKTTDAHQLMSTNNTTDVHQLTNKKHGKQIVPCAGGSKSWPKESAPELQPDEERIFSAAPFPPYA